MSIYPDGVPFTPVTGQSYQNINGTTYRCVAGADGDQYQTGNGWFISPAGWCFKAKNCEIYPDGTISWGHSIFGHFIDK